MNTEIPDTKWTAPGCDVPFTIAYKNCMVYAGYQLCAIEDALGTQHNACKPSWKTVSVNLAAKSDRANAIRLYMSNYKKHLPIQDHTALNNPCPGDVSLSVEEHDQTTSGGHSHHIG